MIHVSKKYINKNRYPCCNLMIFYYWWPLGLLRRDTSTYHIYIHPRLEGEQGGEDKSTFISPYFSLTLVPGKHVLHILSSWATKFACPFTALISPASPSSHSVASTRWVYPNTAASKYPGSSAPKNHSSSPSTADRAETADSASA